jgi:hypothetical protein
MQSSNQISLQKKTGNIAVCEHSETSACININLIEYSCQHGIDVHKKNDNKLAIAVSN